MSKKKHRPVFYTGPVAKELRSISIMKPTIISLEWSSTDTPKNNSGHNMSPQMEIHPHGRGDEELSLITGYGSRKLFVTQ